MQNMLLVLPTQILLLADVISIKNRITTNSVFSVTFDTTLVL